MTLEEHWENVFRTKSPADASWHAPHLADSLRAIKSTDIAKTAAILDVGAGESTLLEDLLHEGFSDLTAIDISSTALAKMRQRLGQHGGALQWIVGDVSTVALPPQRYDLWHDRAVFHFLVEPDRRQSYVAQVRYALRPRGSVILSTFGPDGPTRCSGLDVCRYDSATLFAEFGSSFELLDANLHEHMTPAGKPQQFQQVWMRLREDTDPAAL